MIDSAEDWRIRSAALAAITRLAEAWDWEVPWARIAEGFGIGGQRFLYATKALGIYVPKGAGIALSVKTTVPKAGRGMRYRDQNPGGLVTYTDSGLLSYDLQAQGAHAEANNRALLRAMERRLPLIYFHGIRPGAYQPIAPVWVTDFHPDRSSVALSPGDVAGVRTTIRVPEVMGSAYTAGFHQRKVDRARFNTAVCEAYDSRCAVSGLPERELLVGARIAPDAKVGPDLVSDGICMSVLHRGAYNANLIGIDPEYRVHVSRRLGPAGKEAVHVVKDLEGGRIALPKDAADWPSREHLAARFELFLESQRPGAAAR